MKEFLETKVSSSSEHDVTTTEETIPKQVGGKYNVILNTFILKKKFITARNILWKESAHL